MSWRGLAGPAALLVPIAQDQLAHWTAPHHRRARLLGPYDVQNRVLLAVLWPVADLLPIARLLVEPVRLLRGADLVAFA